MFGPKLIDLGDFTPTLELYFRFLNFSRPLLVQRRSGNANGARSSHLTEYEPVISILDPIQAIFDIFCITIFVTFRRNPSKSSPYGSRRPRTNFFGIIAEAKVSKSVISFG